MASMATQVAEAEPAVMAEMVETEPMAAVMAH
jgi:hypothetical protein